MAVDNWSLPLGDTDDDGLDYDKQQKMVTAPSSGSVINLSNHDNVSGHIASDNREGSKRNCCAS